MRLTLVIIRTWALSPDRVAPCLPMAGLGRALPPLHTTKNATLDPDGLHVGVIRQGVQSQLKLFVALRGGHFRRETFAFGLRQRSSRSSSYWSIPETCTMRARNHTARVQAAPHHAHLALPDRAQADFPWRRRAGIRRAGGRRASRTLFSRTCAFFVERPALLALAAAAVAVAADGSGAAVPSPSSIVAPSLTLETTTRGTVRSKNSRKLTYRWEFTPRMAPRPRR
jgi:hypothetical protein